MDGEATDEDDPDWRFFQNVSVNKSFFFCNSFLFFKVLRKQTSLRVFILLKMRFAVLEHE